MIRLVDGTCWWCEQQCEGRWCTPDCREAWELDMAWIRKAAELAVTGRVVVHNLEEVIA